jgi:hypothetical protein
MIYKNPNNDNQYIVVPLNCLNSKVYEKNGNTLVKIDKEKVCNYLKKKYQLEIDVKKLKDLYQFSLYKSSKLIILEEMDVTKCKFYKNEICEISGYNGDIHIKSLFNDKKKQTHFACNTFFRHLKEGKIKMVNINNTGKIYKSKHNLSDENH